MRKFSYQIGTAFESRRSEDPWQRREPTEIYIVREPSKRLARSAAPRSQSVTFGKRNQRSMSIARVRPFSLQGLTSLFQDPRNTSRTKVR